jgi:hypothetical protein
MPVALQSIRTQSSRQYLFTLLGSTRVKAVRRMLVKLSHFLPFCIYHSYFLPFYLSMHLFINLFISPSFNSFYFFTSYLSICLSLYCLIFLLLYLSFPMHFFVNLHRIFLTQQYIIPKSLSTFVQFSNGSVEIGIRTCL